IESPGLDLPANWSHFEARPPFALEDEQMFLERHEIDVLVTKNSGSEATAAKLDAARRLSLPVIMVARPAPFGPPDAETAQDMADLLRTRYSTG
ncbi:MAG: precorrin-6A/cobalt-precorrin-6A reductase, partial [Fimbriimonadaceae bacterium]|nr:precorrin-6A/cobalt-precorrin-6A reductase [Alphaproteobacteria bacterium]